MRFVQLGFSAVLGVAAALAACEDDPGSGTSTTTSTSTSPSGGSGGTTTSGGGGAGGMTTSSGGEGGSGGAAGGAPPEADLTNNDDTCEPFWIAPMPSEVGHWGAARLTPSSYPFDVGQIRYRLFLGDPACVSLAHSVEVFVTTTDAPPGTPSVLDSWAVPANSEDGWGWIYLDVDPPITLQSGEHLFISVEMSGNAQQQVLCLGCCEGEDVIGFKFDRNYWSNATDPPYPWAGLEDFGLTRNYEFEAFAAP